MSTPRTAPYGTATDDSGSLTDGTIGNNAWLQGLLDLVDTRWSRTTTTSTGTQTVINPSDADVLLCNNASDLTIRSITAPSATATTGVVPLRRLIVASIGAGNVFLNHQDTTGTTAANRLINFATSGSTPLAAGVGVAMYLYDTNASRWRLVSHEQGAWITPAFSAGDFTGNGSLTVTVASGDVGQMKYRLSGRSLRVAFRLVTVSTGGTASDQIRIGNGQWGGYTIASTDSRSVVKVKDATNADAFGQAVAGTLVDSTRIVLLKDAAGGNWSNAATDTTNAIGEVEFEVT